MAEISAPESTPSPSPELSRFRFYVRALVAPALLSLVAVNQIQMTKTSDLSPWKGGGFGMFSTLDSPSQRIVRIYVDTPTGRHRVKCPVKIDQISKQLRVSPTVERAQKLGTGVFKYIVERLDSIKVEALQDSPAGGDITDESSLVSVLDDAVAVVPDQDAKQAGRDFVEKYGEIQAVHIEVWFLRFDQKTKKMWSEQVLVSDTRNPVSDTMIARQ